MAEARRWPKGRTILKWVALSLLALVLVGAGTVLAVANSQDGSVRVLQALVVKDYPPNSFSPRAAPADRILSDGMRLTSDVRYAAQYPNSYLDIWYPDGNIQTRRPTIVNIHGGGFFMGDKTTGDPLAKDAASADPLVRAYAAAGFNVVNLNYALAPDYRYPVPLVQVNQALGFLIDHADAYGLDMDNVILTGGSGGAHLSAQYGLLVSDPAYAAQLGIKPALRADQLKGLGLMSAPLRFSGFGWRMNAMMWAYLGTKNLESSPQIRQTDILAHLNPRYPATYITDGNDEDTFPDHAKALARRLSEEGVECEFYFTEKEVAVLGHGYTFDLSTPYGRENLKRAIAFFSRRTGLQP